MRRLFIFVLLLLLTISGAAWAQDDALCGGLNEDDCALLQRSQAAMPAVTAAAVELSFDMAMDVEGTTIPISLTGSGVYSGIDPDSEAESADEVADGLRDINAELILTFELPRDLMRGTGIPNAITLELRLVDGVGYINFDELQALINDPSFTGWGGLDLAGLVGSLLEDYPDIVEQMAAAGTGGLDPEIMAQFEGEEFATKYLTITRTDDGSGDSATFELVLDFGGMMSNPDFSDVMRDQMEQQLRSNNPGMSRAEMRATLDAMMEIFEDAEIVVREDIDTTTALISSISVDFAFDMTEMGAGNVSFNMALSYDYENVPTITAPEDASILPYEQLLGMLMGMVGTQT